MNTTRRSCICNSDRHSCICNSKACWHMELGSLQLYMHLKKQVELQKYNSSMQLRSPQLRMQLKNRLSCTCNLGHHSCICNSKSRLSCKNATRVYNSGFTVAYATHKQIELHMQLGSPQLHMKLKNRLRYICNPDRHSCICNYMQLKMQVELYMQLGSPQLHMQLKM